MNIGYHFIHVYVLQLLILESIQQKLENDYAQLNDANELTNTMVRLDFCFANKLILV